MRTLSLTCCSPYNLLDKPDLVIRTRNGDFKVHQKILCTSSKRLATDIADSAKLTAFISTITTQKQAVAASIPVHVVSESAEVISHVLHYLYNKRGFNIVAPGAVAVMTSSEIKDMLHLCTDICAAAEKVRTY